MRTLACVGASFFLLGCGASHDMVDVDFVLPAPEGVVTVPLGG